ncbi:HAMP domain-containing histidine kinase [Puniceicoccus vermicola]|uniref:HAMP domain-containing histidine kinase n=1 Tax=Puniceicoccus vermicola TaxID=388746 RepID=A0A7X1B4T4_9BACT|nr:HAMP domain-containing histidine kinase [Puniceicoccus vermicola]MBC2604395.1 HAMP domain-containing histidine kinase [Puniceicoccus vermicola]
MEWFRSPLLLIAFVLYALLMVSLLAIYFRGSSDKSEEGSSTANAAKKGPHRASRSSVTESSESVILESDFEEGDQSSRSRDSGLDELVREAEKLFSSEKEPIFVADAGLNIFYRNRAARKVFGDHRDSGEEPFASVLGANEKAVWKQFGDQDSPTMGTISCLLPNGKNGSAQVRLAVMNRMPRVYALRVTGLEEEKPSWLSRSAKGTESTSLTRGAHLDFREVDPASVELSADQMLAPLREIDGLLKKVNDSQLAGDSEGSKRSLQPARNKLRRLIRHIEEIDWMLQVTDGHLHQRPENFQAYAVLAEMAEAANRLTTGDGPRLKLDPEEAPAVEPILSGDRRIFEKVLTQLLTSAFRATGSGEIIASFRSEALENPTQSDDWYLFAGEGESGSQATAVTIRIEFQRPEEPSSGSDLPAVVETLGAQILDPRMTKRLDFVKKGRDSDLFGLTLARELVGKLDGDLAFQSDASGRSEFVLRLQFENAGA